MADFVWTWNNVQSRQGYVLSNAMSNIKKATTQGCPEEVCQGLKKALFDD